MEFRIFQDKRGDWRWRLVAVNGRTVADSGEGYSREDNARRAVKKIQTFGDMMFAAAVVVDPKAANQRISKIRKTRKALADIGTALETISKSFTEKGDAETGQDRPETTVGG